MKINKIIAVITAFCLIGNPFFSAEYNKENLLTVSAAEVIESGEYGDNLTWTVYSDGVIAIEGIGDMKYTRGINQYPWYPYNDEITKVNIGEGVTSFAARSFVGYDNIEEIVIPSTMKNINGFAHCKSLKSIVLPEGLLTIEMQAFSGCELLQTVTIPSTVTEIGNGAFELCDNLTAINVVSGNKNFVDVDGVLFAKDMKTIIQYPMGKTQTSYVVPSTVETIGYGAFRYAENLENIILPDGLTAIDYGALGSTSIKSIQIPKGVSVISKSALNSCKSMESLVIPANVTKIDEMAIRNNASLKEIVIENPLCEIFDDCCTISSNLLTDESYKGIIYSYVNSTAQAYAEKYNYKFETIENYYNKFKLGDVNGDGVVDAADATLVLRQYSAESMQSESIIDDEQKLRANVNNDDTIDPRDATLILQYYAYHSMGGDKSIEDFISNQ